MSFHCSDRTFNHVLSNSDPEKFAMRVNKRRNSPQAYQRQHQQESADEFETCGKAFHTITRDLKPIGQRWFVETKLVVEKGDDEISALAHFPRRFGETWFVAVD